MDADLDLFMNHSTWSNSKCKPVSFREANDDRQCIASLKDKDSNLQNIQLDVVQAVTYCTCCFGRWDYVWSTSLTITTYLIKLTSISQLMDCSSSPAGLPQCNRMGGSIRVSVSHTSHTTPYHTTPIRMSRAVSTTNVTSDAGASLQRERLSEDTTEKVPQTREEQNISAETSDASVLWVDWDDPGDPMNPKKWVVQLLFCPIGNNLNLTYYSSWPYRQKWAATIVVSSFTFISPVSSSMIAPAAAQVSEQLGITSNVLVAMTTSIFILGYGEYFLYAPPHRDF